MVSGLNFAPSNLSYIRKARDLDRPIIFVGTHRSGTTWMGNVFSRHPELAYWVEPRHVWTWSHGYNPHDRLTETDASPSVRAHIRCRFERFLISQGASRLVEKTPSNCLRLPFIRAIYPNARIVLAIRDGRSVIASTKDIQQQGVQPNLIFRRALQTPITEWPAYADRLATALSNKITHKPMRYWGPRPEGWKAWLKDDKPDAIRAKQWASTILTAHRDAKIMGDVMIFRFEDLISKPRETMERLVSYCELDNADDIINHVAATADPKRNARRHSERSNADLEHIRPILEPALEELGYPWQLPQQQPATTPTASAPLRGGIVVRPRSIAPSTTGTAFAG